MKKLTVEIWSDIVCPWCYIGERRFEKALEQFAHRDQVEIIWRSYQLDPRTPRGSKEKTLDMLSSKYGISKAEAAMMEQRVASQAQSEGLPMSSERYTANTFDAHRLLHYAASKGKQEELLHALFAAHFADNEIVDNIDTLVKIASEHGLDGAEVRQVLESDAYSAEVRADLQRAASFGITGVPFFVLNEEFGVSGGQPSEVFAHALQHAWEHSSSSAS